MSSKNITLEGNIVSNIIGRTTLETGDGVLDKSAAFSICTYFGSDPTCADIKVKNNLAAGSIYSGFLLPGHDCADTSGRYSGNVAHSINGALSGTGVYFNEAPGQKCT
jgi:hypothetical protein